MQVTLPEFLNCLYRDGRVRAARPADVPNKEIRRADRVLLAFEREYRRELPGTPPPVYLPAARWAATMFYRACQFVAFRDVGEEVMAGAMAASCPPGNAASVHYSVDITFRYLPDLAKLARSAAEHDPLLTHLARWAVDWPLSSVGMAGIGSVQIDNWAKNQCLLRLYVDRVIARGDESRLGDQRVREAVQQAIGLFPELATKMASACAGDAIPEDVAGENLR